MTRVTLPRNEEKKIITEIPDRDDAVLLPRYKVGVFLVQSE